MRSAPTLKIWMTPLASVAMLEKLALLKIALCRAPVFSSASACRTSTLTSAASGAPLWVVAMSVRSTVLSDAPPRQTGVNSCDRWPGGSVSDALATAGGVRVFRSSVAAGALEAVFRFAHLLRTLGTPDERGNRGDELPGIDRLGEVHLEAAAQ